MWSHKKQCFIPFHIKIYPVKTKLGTPTRGVLGKTPIYSSRAEKKTPTRGVKEGDIEQNATALRGQYSKIWDFVELFV
jgi:hypothetical protein